MIIRNYKKQDREIIKEIAANCFNDVSVDQNLEKMFGRINGKNWQWRKKKKIDNDIAINAEGIFLAEENNEIIGFISNRIDKENKIGKIENLAVLPGNQKKGVGRKLIDRSILYFKEKGMELVQIDTLAQNEVTLKFYPKYGFKEYARHVHYIMSI